MPWEGLLIKSPEEGGKGSKGSFHLLCTYCIQHYVHSNPIIQASQYTGETGIVQPSTRQLLGPGALCQVLGRQRQTQTSLHSHGARSLVGEQMRKNWVNTQ